MSHLSLLQGLLRQASGLMTAGLVLFLAACASSPATTPAPTATGGASAKTVPTVAAKEVATTTPSADKVGTPKATDTGGTPAPQATLVEPKELAGKGNPNAKVTIIEFSDFQ